MVKNRKNRVGQILNDTQKGTENQNPTSDYTSPLGDLKTQLVRIPNPICFTESLEKVRSSIENIQFYMLELQDRLVFLQESFDQLQTVKNAESQQVYVSKPKTGQQIANIFKENQQSIEKLTRGGASIIFPRKNSFQEANDRTKGKIEPKKKNSRSQPSDSTSTSGSENLNPPKTIFIQSKVKTGPQTKEKTPVRTINPPKNRRRRPQVGKEVYSKDIKSDEKQNYVNFERFVQKIIKNLDDTHINNS